LALVAIVGNQVQYILLSYFTHGSSNLIVIGCVYMELLLKNERKLHWQEWSLDAISCASIRPTPHLLFCYHFI